MGFKLSESFFCGGLLRSSMGAFAAWIVVSSPIYADENVGSQSAEQLLTTLRDDPNNGSARLALAKLNFEARRDQTAEFNLRQALASDLTSDEAEEAFELLAALQLRRRWIFTSDFALAQDESRSFLVIDTDESGAPVSRLEADSSGFGLAVSGALENRFALSERMRFSTRLDLVATVFENERFDDAFLTLRAGPLFFGGGDDRVGVRAVWQQRHEGGASTDRSIGGEVFVQNSIGRTFSSFGRLTLLDVDAPNTGSDRRTYALDGALTHYGRSGRFERISGLAFRSDAEAGNQSFWFLRVAAGAYRELPYSLGLFAEPFVTFQDFGAVDLVSGEAREDYAIGLQLRASKRDWRIFGTLPFANIRLEAKQSTIDAFDSSDASIQFGLTRTF